MKEKRKLGFNLTETFKGDVVPKPTKWIYSLSGIGRDAAYTLISLFFLTYIQYTGVLDEAQYAVQFGVITAIIVIARIWDGVNDPMIGSKTPIGNGANTNLGFSLGLSPRRSPS
jgi:hypothetical protein